MAKTQALKDGALKEVGGASQDAARRARSRAALLQRRGVAARQRLGRRWRRRAEEARERRAAALRGVEARLEAETEKELEALRAQNASRGRLALLQQQDEAQAGRWRFGWRCGRCGQVEVQIMRQKAMSRSLQKQLEQAWRGGSLWF